MTPSELSRLAVRLACVAGCTAGVLAAVGHGAARADGSFPTMLTEADRDRLARYDTVRRETLAYVREHGQSDDVRVVDDALRGEARSVSPARMAGDWRCRTIKLSQSPTLPVVIYADFRCRITDDSAGLRLTKLTGSQRTAGAFYDLGEKRLGYAGAQALADDPKAPRYGEREDRNQVGYLIPLSARHMRLEFPAPALEADLEVLELRR